MNADSPAWTSDLGAHNAGVIKPSPGKIYSVTCNNENAAQRFLLLLDQTTTPVNGQVPVYVLVIEANKQGRVGSETLTNFGRLFPTGIAWAFSSTHDTVTLATATEQSSFFAWA